MVWLRFNMNLGASSSLLTGKLSIMDGDSETESFTVTSGLPSFQDRDDQSYRSHGPIPSCRRVGLSSYSVRTTPFDETGVVGIDGNFYYIEPDPVVVDGVQRGEFGIHFDENVPGSAGCIAFRQSSEWRHFQDFMNDYKRQGFQAIALIVEYDTPHATAVKTSTGGSFLTVDSPLPGLTQKINTNIEFSGTAKSDVGRVIVTIGPGGPFKIVDVQPSSGKWKFTQVLVSPGVNRPVKVTALDTEGNFLQTIAFTITLTP